MPGLFSRIRNVFHTEKNVGPDIKAETIEDRAVDDGTSHQIPSAKRFVCGNKHKGCWCGKKLEERGEMSEVNKQLLEAAFHGTLSETVKKSADLQTHATNPLKPDEDIKAEGESDKEANKIGWTDSQLMQLQKAVKTVANTGRKKLQVPGFHAIQGLRKARECGCCVKDEGPANAEKYGMKFWGDVAKIVTSPEKHGIKRSADDCIDAYVRLHDPCISGTVLEKLLSARADPNIVDRTGISPLHYAARGCASADCYLQDLRMLLRVNANPLVADINGNTPMHFFALAAAEEGVIKGDTKKDEKGTSRQKEERNKAKRIADLIEALGPNKKCQNCNGDRAQDTIKAMLDKLDKFEKQKVQDLKTIGNPHPFWGMLLSRSKMEPVDESFKQVKKQLEKLKKQLG